MLTLKIRVRYGISTVLQNKHFGLRIEVFLTFWDFSENNHSYFQHKRGVVTNHTVTQNMDCRLSVYLCPRNVLN